MRKTALACCFLFILSFMQIHALMNYEVIQTEELGLGDRFTVFRIFSDINEPVTYADARRIVLKKQNRVDYSEHISTRCNVIDYQGNLLSSTEFYTIGDFSNGLAPAQFYANSTFGFIDETGEFAIPPKFDHAGPFCNGLAPASVNGRWGYVDTTGEFVKLYDDPAITAYVFSDGVAWLRRPNQEAEIESYFYTLIDTQFHELFTIEARLTVPFNEGISCVKMFDLTPDGKPFYYVRIIDKQGTTLFRVDEPNTYAYTRIKNGYIYSANQLLDLNGTPMPSSLEGINRMEMFGDGVFTARREGELLLFDQAGNILKTLPSERVHSLSHGLSYLTFSYKWYHYLIFDNQCQTKEVLPPVYSRHLPFPQKTAGPERCVALRPGWGTALVGDEFRLIERPVSREVTPLLMDGRTMVPIRFLVESLQNYDLDWDENGQSLLFLGEKRLALTIGGTEVEETVFDETKNKYVTNTHHLDTPPLLLHDRTYVPVRLLSELLGYHVYWDDRGLVLVTNQPAEFNRAYADRYLRQFEGIMDITEFPDIDGSTSTIPLSTAVARKMLSLSEQDLLLFGRHTRTSNAFQQLLNGGADLLLTVEPDAQMLEQAAQSGVELEYYTIAKEGFVFMVNRQNPLDGLTTAQIQNIYQGNITNWQKVGGTDSNILPFQRNALSGSQSIMENLVMKDLQMLPPDRTTINSMGGIIDQVAEFDNAENSIGYSVYYFFNRMHNRDETKLLSVDGMEPSNENIQNGTYPYIINYCAVIRKDEPKDSGARKILNWLLSEDGKQLISDTGFVPAES